MNPSPLFTEPLLADVIADVCIIGAGITGMSCAYTLAQSGKRVVVIDEGGIAGGETARTTAHLSAALAQRFHVLETIHGAAITALAAESHMAAIDRIEEIIDAHGIACDFKRLDGYLFAAPGTDCSELEKERDAARRAGLQVALLTETPAIGAVPSLRFARMGQMHPLRYVAGLTREVLARRGRIHAPVRATEILAAKHGVVVHTSCGATISCGHVVVATNVPFASRLRTHAAQIAYRTYALSAEIEADAAVEALFWDTGEPYHYVRTERADNGRVSLVVGGEDHRTGHMQADKDYFGALEQWMRATFPRCLDVTHRRSGQVLEPADGLAFIGPNPDDDPRILIATGDAGHGLTHATIAGMVLDGLIDQGTHPFAHVYDPARTTTAPRVRADRG